MSCPHLAAATMSYRRACRVTVLVPVEGAHLASGVGYLGCRALEEAKRAYSRASSHCRVPPKGGQS